MSSPGLSPAIHSHFEELEPGPYSREAVKVTVPLPPALSMVSCSRAAQRTKLLKSLNLDATATEQLLY
ncbi:hypothetical protein I3842_12G096700 [Carya illinoinensis]|uniref:Uncharacterized protein n=1 Tax=Carya illinoinensis TaxID=32201 RepID=A0A922DIQ8_CARIL|nr:hypothetical protein I3842_12G096700 [Carya illinoinensis]